MSRDGGVSATRTSGGGWLLPRSPSGELIVFGAFMVAMIISVGERGWLLALYANARAVLSVPIFRRLRPGEALRPVAPL
ncbi:hypothetical protein [Labedaea rhizosphaerae]|uniref:hypothetical protein n=1 Tax=Labedaea rhizosphaerae TaxID=598644 RepID=UPI00105D5C80|nr:hypothetical protein [Labedaea rhizosphaerae]